jgi:medium-chain acyl-[acyl-carrier-protein] hydrolase
MGALIAFEMARYIRSHYSLSPSYIVVSGSNAPQRKVPHAQKSVLHQLPDGEFIAEIQRLYENIHHTCLKTANYLN